MSNMKIRMAVLASARVTQRVRPPRDIDEIHWNTAEHDGFPPATITPFEQRRGCIPQGADEVELSNLVAALVSDSRQQGSDRNAELQRAGAARAHGPVGTAS